MPDLFFYRDPEEAEKEEQARQEALAAQAAPAAPVGKVDDQTWGGEEMTTDWANEPAPGLAAPSSLILGSLSLPPSTRLHPSSYTANLGACSPSLPRRPSQTTRHHSLGTSTDTTLQPPAHSFSAL